MKLWQRVPRKWLKRPKLKQNACRVVNKLSEDEMGAFLVGGFAFVITIFLFVIVLMTYGMSDRPIDQQSRAPLYVLFGGMAFSGLIVASHWMPSIGW